MSGRSTFSLTMNAAQQKEIMDAFTEQMKAICRSKGDDYANDDRLSNFKKVGMATGLLPAQVIHVLLATKVARLVELQGKGKTPNHEGVEDTLIDLANYAALGYMIHTEQQQQAKGELLQKLAKAGNLEFVTRSYGMKPPSDSAEEAIRNAKNLDDLIPPHIKEWHDAVFRGKRTQAPGENIRLATREDLKAAQDEIVMNAEPGPGLSEFVYEIGNDLKIHVLTESDTPPTATELAGFVQRYIDNPPQACKVHKVVKDVPGKPGPTFPVRLTPDMFSSEHADQVVKDMVSCYMFNDPVYDGKSPQYEPPQKTESDNTVKAAPGQFVWPEEVVLVLESQGGGVTAVRDQASNWAQYLTIGRDNYVAYRHSSHLTELPTWSLDIRPRLERVLPAQALNALNAAHTLRIFWDERRPRRDDDYRIMLRVGKFVIEVCDNAEVWKHAAQRRATADINPYWCDMVDRLRKLPHLYMLQAEQPEIDAWAALRSIRAWAPGDSPLKQRLTPDPAPQNEPLEPHPAYSWRGPAVVLAISLDSGKTDYLWDDDPSWAQYMEDTITPDTPGWADTWIPMLADIAVRHRYSEYSREQRIDDLLHSVTSIYVMKSTERKPQQKTWITGIHDPVTAEHLSSEQGKMEHALLWGYKGPDTGMAYMQAELTLETGFDTEETVTARFWSTYSEYRRIRYYDLVRPMLSMPAGSTENWNEIIKHLTPELLRAFGPDCVQHYDTLGRLTIQGPDGKRLAVASRLEVRKLKTDVNA